MTDAEIERYRQRMVEVKRIPNSGDRNKAFIELEMEIGASGCGKDMPTGERDVQHIASIHQALQTASMVNMCSAATNGYKIATQASKNARIHFWVAAAIAFLSALAAAGSAAVAWIAVMRN
jgi:hypothetical protein